jgi:hypothetical protein
MQVPCAIRGRELQGEAIFKVIHMEELYRSASYYQVSKARDKLDLPLQTPHDTQGNEVIEICWIHRWF